MNEDTTYLLKAFIASLMTSMVIIAFPLGLTLQIITMILPTRYQGIPILACVGFLFVIMKTAFKPLMNRLLVFYGGEKLKKILKEDC